VKPDLSVVIPTFNRADLLPGVLEALGRQREGGDFEVVVVDDGSRDDTPAILASFQGSFPFRFFRQDNAGPAAARNRGVQAAQGEWIVFLGDDTVPEPDFLAEHRAAHARHPGRRIAVLGYTTWPRERKVTPFLDQINEFGLQFGYELIEDPEKVPFNFFYTSNISLPRRLLLEAGLFDTTFPHAAWEDIELSYRLFARGMIIVYCAAAVVRHYHDITFDSFRRRQRRAGEAAAIFYRKHPELSSFLAVPQALSLAPETQWRERLERAWARLGSRWEIPAGRRAIESVLRRDYLAGLRQALHGQVGPQPARAGSPAPVIASQRRSNLTPGQGPPES
jgi:GT2 family glycosyltransferase